MIINDIVRALLSLHFPNNVIKFDQLNLLQFNETPNIVFTVAPCQEKTDIGQRALAVDEPNNRLIAVSYVTGLYMPQY